MSNTEFRMMKFGLVGSILRPSTFLVRPARYGRKQTRRRCAALMNATVVFSRTALRRAGGYSAVYPPDLRRVFLFEVP